MDYADGYTGWTQPSGGQMDYVFQLCRNDDWSGILRELKKHPMIATTSMIMDNHISTTVLHQAITSKGNTRERAEVVGQILKLTPQAAAIKNGYGSLPLHVIAQRNTKMDAPTKELLIKALVLAHKEALIEPGGVGKRTPLHIIFTDYISPALTRLMIDYGSDACFMRDKKGFLPAHVACSRHCSPEKLRMLLGVNPQALRDETVDGHTLLSLATSTATKSHPNYALIDELNRQLLVSSSGQATIDDFTLEGSPPPAEKTFIYSTPLTSDMSASMDSHESPLTSRRIRKRKLVVPEDAAVNLLLHFSRHGSPRVEHMSPPRVEPIVHTDFAEV
ncbi:hypothetical protein MPSEU_000277900 [Mayamaea pseudoterrestris]|nr:hypothetical protein MPSEU_000277900 [Mayamaea pseudoterrestris]